AEQHVAAGDLAVGGASDQPLLAPRVHADPPGPIDLVEEPVHHDDEHDDREQARRGLNLERRNVVGEAVDEPHDAEPGGERSRAAEHGAESDWPAIGLRRTVHRRGDRRNDEDRLEPLAEHEHRDVDDARRRALGGGRVRRPTGGHDREDGEDRDDRRRANQGCDPASARPMSTDSLAPSIFSGAQPPARRSNRSLEASYAPRNAMHAINIESITIKFIGIWADQRSRLTGARVAPVSNPNQFTRNWQLRRFVDSRFNSLHGARAGAYFARCPQ